MYARVPFVCLPMFIALENLDRRLHEFTFLLVIAAEVIRRRGDRRLAL